MTDPNRSAGARVHVGAPFGRRPLLKAATASLAACVGCARATLHATVSAHLQQLDAAPDGPQEHDRFVFALGDRAPDGIVVYYDVCPHTGCDVSDWLNGSQTLLCPCYASEFDPAVNARVVRGPARTRLTSLALQIVDALAVHSIARTAR